MDKKYFYPLILLFFVAALFLWFMFLTGTETGYSDGSSQKSLTPLIPAGGDLISKKEYDSFAQCAADGNPLLESYPRQCRDSRGELYTEDIGNELKKMDFIRIDNPRPNQLISSPLTVTGSARGFWFFEGSFPVKLLDGRGNILAEGAASALGDWMTADFVPFRIDLFFEAVHDEQGILELKKDNPSGLPENDDQLTVPVVFAKKETAGVKVFFGKIGVDDFDCGKVFPVERTIAKTEAVARAALLELLAGPTDEEKKLGYFSSLNEGVTIKNLSISRGLARVDFSAKLGEAVGGSCRVGAIRAQITETLKQFATVKEVVIAIEGRVEDILQP